MTETLLRHHRDKTETRPRQDRDTTETRPRHHRDKEASSVDIRATAFCHSYTGLPKGAQYTKSNWNFRFCVKTRSKCSSMFISLSPKNQNTITKAKNSTATSTTQHQAITPLIIRTSQHHHQTSRRLRRNMPETSPTHH